MKIKRFVKRFFFAFSVVAVIVSISMFSVSAVNYSTYSDTTINTSYVENLLSLRDSDQLRKDYIISRVTSNRYVLVMADDWKVKNNSVTCSECDIIFYDTSYGTDNNTRYGSTTANDCTFTVNHIVVSNFLKGASKPDNTNFFDFLKIGIAIIIALLIFKIIRGFK